MGDYIFSEFIKKDKDGIEKTVLAFRDSMGYLLDKKEALGLKQKILKDFKKIDSFYNIKDIDEFIEDYNIKRGFYEYKFSYDKENEVYLLKEPAFDKRKPKLKNRNSWGFTCAWCGKKWTSKERDYYYRAYFAPYGKREDGLTVCSENCAKNASLNIQKEWINKKGYSKFFMQNKN